MLPPPADLERYVQHLPDAAERLLAAAEREQAQRHQIENRLLAIAVMVAAILEGSAWRRSLGPLAHQRVRPTDGLGSDREPATAQPAKSPCCRKRFQEAFSRQPETPEAP